MKIGLLTQKEIKYRCKMVDVNSVEDLLKLHVIKPTATGYSRNFQVAITWQSELIVDMILGEK